jgi:excisionase family DNA binding protein
MSAGPAAVFADALERLLTQLLQQALSQQPRSLVPGEERSAWMSTASAAPYLDWPVQRLYKLSASGAIPHYKQEGRLLFHRDELEQWLQQYRHADGTTG